ncbi:hypothetical protein [Shewanella mangrovisoli]|uniref:hypothetical protein n=1 Tax=Shewanella mangrovisoli TaxID=2864211 RepID=UPI001C659FE4|nr:hypothetical protein [Shewanella mangrovisoli]QYK07565.1 hypothetical protein K0H60_12005 [Shewanella mangrovisoli]
MATSPTPISRNSLKIFKPELLGSSNEAGGQRTNNAVQSGQINELFDAISDIDHAQSSIEIAKAYPTLYTDDTGKLKQAHLFFSEPPVDPLVNVFMIESPALDDESRMSDMKEIIESSVNAGELIREGGPGFLVNQNSFSSDYLQSMYRFNDRDYWKTTYLQVGQVICITVEYTGVENADWPRKTHFAKVTKTSIVNGYVGTVSFEPPIPFATPWPSLNINGQTNCTKLRLSNTASPLKFHGVTKLTAVANGVNLAVGTTQLSLLPAITTILPKPGNTIVGGSENGDATVSQVIRKVINQPASEGTYSYTFTTPDLLTDDNGLVAVSTVPTANMGGYTSYIQSVTIGTGNITVTLSSSARFAYSPQVSLFYVSSYKYSIYSNADPFPANKQLTVGSLKGRVVFDDANYAPQDVYEHVSADGNSGKLYDGTEHLATIDYLTGVVTPQVVSRGTFTLTYSGLVESSAAAAAGDTVAKFTLAVPNPLLESFYVQVERVSDRALISASADAQGVVTGAGVEGTITNGIVELTFSAAVDLITLRYDISDQVRQLPPAEIYGLNPLRIPNDGIVDMFRQWGTIALSHSQVQQVTGNIGTVYNIRENATFSDITDANGASLWTSENTHYTVNKAAGTVTINSDFAGFAAPFVLTDVISELALVSSFTSSSIVLAKQLSREYPIGATVASVQILGDLQARVGQVRDMTAWANNWDVDGATATGNYNSVDYPIEVKNNTAVNEDWAFIMTSPTAFRCVGRRLGQIGSGDILNDFAPINPVTNTPYFILRKGGWGGGWQTGEVLRFPTFAASKPVMLLRNVQVGHSQITTDKAVLSFFGNES